MGSEPRAHRRGALAGAAERGRRGRPLLVADVARRCLHRGLRRLARRHRHAGGPRAMDKLLNEFTVNRPIEETWTVLTDVELIAPCMPGAQLQEIEGDIYRGLVKVKLGAITTSFKGQASFTERDDTGHRAVLKAEGRDTGGKGNADALITATLESVSPEVTKCVVATDLRVTGKVAQFGRGIMADVSKKIMGQFATNLNTMLDAQGSA